MLAAFLYRLSTALCISYNEQSSWRTYNKVIYIHIVKLCIAINGLEIVTAPRVCLVVDIISHNIS